MQDQLEGVARERVDAFSQGGGVVARLPIGGEPLSHILANLSIQQRQQVSMGTGKSKLQKKFDNEGYSFTNFGVRPLYQDPCRPLKQCCGSAMVSKRIHIQHTWSMRNADDQKLEKITSGKIILF